MLVIRNAAQANTTSDRLAKRLSQLSRLRSRALKATDACCQAVRQQWTDADADAATQLVQQQAHASRRMSDLRMDIDAIESRLKHAPRIRRVRDDLQQQRSEAHRQWAQANDDAHAVRERINHEQERLLKRLDSRAIYRLIDQRHAVHDFIRGVNDDAGEVLRGALA